MLFTLKFIIITTYKYTIEDDVIVNNILLNTALTQTNLKWLINDFRRKKMES